ncbi:MAG: EamA family transporter [Balneolaceae bacterium]|nr:EamA family transporter [Balneolaceae bacterium]
MESDKLAYLYVIIGASLWGIIGIFIERLDAAGFTSLQIVTLRVVTAAVLLTLYLAVRHPEALKIEGRDFFLFAGTGIVSIVFFNWCYFSAIKEVSLSIAVILLYTGPSFVVLISAFLLGERITKVKAISILLTFTGCVLVIRLFPLAYDTITAYGLLLGLGSGLGYALYSIFGKMALKRYSPVTVITYTFIFASAALLPTSGITIEISTLARSGVLLNIAGLGLFPTVIAYMLYTRGLDMIESGRASISATFEPLVATLVGILLFEEVLTIYQVIGMLLIIGAVILIQMEKDTEAEVSPAELK